jgi:hypothetical protein
MTPEEFQENPDSEEAREKLLVEPWRELDTFKSKLEHLQSREFKQFRKLRATVSESYVEHIGPALPINDESQDLACDEWWLLQYFDGHCWITEELVPPWIDTLEDYLDFKRSYWDPEEDTQSLQSVFELMENAIKAGKFRDASGLKRTERSCVAMKALSHLRAGREVHSFDDPGAIDYFLAGCAFERWKVEPNRDLGLKGGYRHETETKPRVRKESPLKKLVYFEWKKLRKTGYSAEFGMVIQKLSNHEDLEIDEKEDSLVYEGKPTKNGTIKNWLTEFRKELV